MPRKRWRRGSKTQKTVKWRMSKECQSSPEAKEDYDNMKEMLRLKRENEELRKENLFLKKAAAFFAKEID